MTAASLAKYPSAADFRADLIDFIIGHPAASLWEMAEHYGYTVSWLSTIIATDAFQVALAKRREELVDPILRASLEEKFRGLALRSAEVLEDKMNAHSLSIPDNLALRIFELSTRAAGYGVSKTNVQINNNVGVADDIEKHGDRLVSLLHRKREAVDAEVVTGAPPGGHTEPPGQGPRRDSTPSVQEHLK